MPEVKEVFKKTSKWIGACGGTQEAKEGVPSGQSWKNLSKKINNVVLDYNPNMYESIQV